MRAKQMVLLLSLLLIGALLVACGGEEAPIAAEPTQPAEVEPPEAPPGGPQDVPVSEILDITWQWVELVENETAGQFMVADPENYTISFFEDGSLGVKADCNVGTGAYTVNGNKIEFGPMATTMAMCSPESQHDQFLQLLGQVDIFGMLDGKLVLVLKENAGGMRFQNGGPAEMPEAAPEEITLFVGPEKVPCVGEGPMECYQVKDTPDGEWRLFYNQIEGFQWEPGYNYELRLNVYQVENPPAGGSSLRYELVEEVSKTPMEIENITGIDPDSVTIDTFDLPHTTQPNLVPEKPYDNSQPPGPTGLPQHIQINFGVSAPSEVQPGDPIFYLIPVDAYQEMWDAAGDPGVKNTLALLQITLLNEQISSIPTEGLPVLPTERVTGYNDLAVQSKYLIFDKGYGVRFVGRFNQDPNPVTNEGLFYIFQGYSQDGTYLFSFFYPVETGALPNTAGDISTEEMDRFNQDTAAYMVEHAQALNGLAASDWRPNLETLDSLVSSLNYSMQSETGSESTPSPPAYNTELVNIAWQWAQFNDPIRQTVIPDPENYVLVFSPDNTFGFVADCNSGSGSYTANGNGIALTIGAVTQAACGEESRSDQFIQNLGDVATFVFDNGRLILNLKADAGNLIFNNAGSGIIPPQPGQGAATVKTTEPINVRRGPGAQYSTYGTAPKGTVFEVIGVSPDGEWWVVKLPIEISESGDGWIAVRYAESSGEINVPVVDPPPVEETDPPEPAPSPFMVTVLEPTNLRRGPGR